jgi:hypothetical protein
MSQKNLFISYSRRDTEYVSTLVTALRKEGFDVWFDKNIQTGTDWDSTIEEELKKANAIVLILSETSVASDNVKDEMSYAMGLDKPVIPIKIEECDVPMRLARKQFVDFTIMGQEAGFERLVKDLHLSLNEPAKPVTKGSFKPPKMGVANQEAPKKSKKFMPYLIGGGVTLLLFIIMIMQCGDDTTTEMEQDVSSTENPGWQTANTSHTVNGYLNYIYASGVYDPNYKAAQDSIENLMEWQGRVIYGDPSGRYFVKNLYTDMNGDVVFDHDDEQYPKKGDIVTALVSSQIYDFNTGEVSEGEVLEAGMKAKIVSVREDEFGNVIANINYPDN